MNNELNFVEKQFLNEVLEELKQYQISQKERRDIKQQIVEHIQESREHGDDSLSDLGDTSTFVKDYLEVNGLDLHSEIKQIRNSNRSRRVVVGSGVMAFVVTYLLSQLLLSMFLTESFNPLNEPSFQYNLIYLIDDNLWWNSVLLMISLLAASVVSSIVVLFLRKGKKG
ncbi:hypothetical protein WAK64_12770 [Bacillus spongiae]|uniref:DUF1700 domain-containing protein n=1 Tax=Bacillus spongiae TaxID=2683610 RepID=A0ABU8HEX7_9BACI